ncbi:MAG: site-specific integrase [Nitrospirae bacterium]|nr:MAG: site-specific integrase [Nitrospirota bacterium]
MARKGGKDRGLLRKISADGKGRWYVRIWIEGKEKRLGPFERKTDAKLMYHKIKTEQAEGRFFPERYNKNGTIPAEAWIDEYCDRLATSGKTRSTIRDERYYAHWWKLKLRGKRLAEITPSLLDSIKGQLRSEGKAPQTVHHYLKFLRHVLNVAIREGRLSSNPFSRITMPKVSQGRTRFLTIEEEAKLLEALGPHAYLARLAILTGLRKTELFSLTWNQINLQQRLITLPRTKSGHVQYVPLNSEAAEIFANLQTTQRSKWVFPSKNPLRHINSYNFYGRVFLPAVRRAGLEGVTWHSLRHTFASRLAMSGQSPSTIAALLRHSSLDLVQRYAHLSPNHLQQAIEQVSAFGKKQTSSSN